MDLQARILLHNTILRRMDPVPKRQKKTSISNDPSSARCQRYRIRCDRQRKERLIFVQRMQRDGIQTGQARYTGHLYHYRSDRCQKLYKRSKRTLIIHPHSYIGRNVMKSFSNIIYTGKIVGYSELFKRWNVLYDDDDEEEFDEKDLKLYLVAPYLMRTVRKSFSGKYREGRIYGYTLGFELWYVRYADMSFEYLNEDDIIKYMVVSNVCNPLLPWFVTYPAILPRYCHYNQRTWASL